MSLRRKHADRSALVQGTLDMLILRTLLFGPAHGHQVAKHIRQTTDDILTLEHGSLYPALHRLERKGWVGAKWEVLGSQKRVCKFYRLTTGRKQLAAETLALEAAGGGYRARTGDGKFVRSHEHGQRGSGREAFPRRRDRVAMARSATAVTL